MEKPKLNKENRSLSKILTIITVNKNNFVGLKITQQSLLRQSNQNFRWIVIDGASSDQSIDILTGRADTVISEKDGGIYDAMNKGLTLSPDSYVWFLNSGDILMSDTSVSEVYDKLCVADVIYGDIEMFGKRINRKWKSGKFKKWKLYFGWHPPHSAFICFNDTRHEEKSIFFNESYFISADYDFMLRKLKENDCKISYIQKSLAKMELGGVSNGNIKNIIIANLQCAAAWTSFIKVPAIWLIITKPLLKLKQIRVIN